MKNATPAITAYSVAPIGNPDKVIHGYTLAQVEELTGLEPMDIEYAVEEHGECTTDEYRDEIKSTEW